MIIKRERSPLAIILLAVLLVVIACVSLTFGQMMCLWAKRWQLSALS